MMKRSVIKSSLFVAAISLLIQSCSTTEKFCISAPQNTAFYSISKQSGQNAIAVSQSDNKADVEITSNACYELMLAKTPDFPLRIPVGLDFKHRSVGGAKFAKGFGLTLTSLGGIGVLSGALVMALGGDDATASSGALLGVGVALAGAGTSFGLPADKRLAQTAYQYEFSYDAQQQPLLTGLSAVLLHPDPEKSDENSSASQVSSRRGKATSKASAVSSKKEGVSQGRSRKSLAKLVEGSYTGDGGLFIETNIDDRLSNVVVEITATDKNAVDLIIIENGESFFTQKQRCTVTSDNSGGYILVFDDAPESEITISSSGQLNYTHPNVEIDNTIYTLKITAHK